MVNAGFKYGDSNNQHGTNSGILGGQQNYIAFGADNCHLIGCENVVVAGNVVNFVGVNLTNQYIDYTFSNQTIIGKNDPRILRVTADFTIDGLYDIYEIDLDSIGVGITCTWPVTDYPIQVTFKIYANTSALDFKIDDNNSPSSTIDGNALPYTTGLVTYKAITVYSNGTTLHIISAN